MHPDHHRPRVHCPIASQRRVFSLGRTRPSRCGLLSPERRRALRIAVRQQCTTNRIELRSDQQAEADDRGDQRRKRQHGLGREIGDGQSVGNHRRETPNQDEGGRTWRRATGAPSKASGPRSPADRWVSFRSIDVDRRRQRDGRHGERDDGEVRLSPSAKESTQRRRIFGQRGGCSPALIADLLSQEGSLAIMPADLSRSNGDGLLFWRS